jgi:hypothetical protein
MGVVEGAFEEIVGQAAAAMRRRAHLLNARRESEPRKSACLGRDASRPAPPARAHFTHARMVQRIHAGRA